MLANALGDVLYISEPLAFYRRHDAAATGPYNRVSAKQRIEKSQHVGSGHYDFLASVAQQSAVILEKAQTETDRDNWARHLIEGADKFCKLANVCDLRARLYIENGWLRRVRNFVRLLAQGGYVGNSFYAFGMLSMLKDIHFCVLGDTRRKQSTDNRGGPRSGG